MVLERDRAERNERVLSREQALEMIAFESRLSGRQESTWLLHYRDGWTLEKIALHLGIRPGTARAHLHRAQEKVKRAAWERRYEGEASALWEAFRGGAPSAPLTERLPAARVNCKGDFADVLAAKDGDEVTHLAPNTSSARVKKAHERAISAAKR